MKTTQCIKSVSMAIKFWLGLSASVILLCSCVSGESSADAPFPGSPEAVLQSMSDTWKVNAKRSYFIDYETSSEEGITTLTCKADKGVLTGQCLSVYLCCGADPESTYVEPPYPVPGELLASLSRDISQFKREGAMGSEFTFKVFRSSITDSGKVYIGYNAEFDGGAGYPTLIQSFGFENPSKLRIRRIDFL